MDEECQLVSFPHRERHTEGGEGGERERGGQICGRPIVSFFFLEFYFWEFYFLEQRMRKGYSFRCWMVFFAFFFVKIVGILFP